MGIVLLVDFGSTYTKIRAVDLEKESVVGTSQAPSTPQTDMAIGLQRAYDRLLQHMGIADLKPKRMLACSSAAGGLRIIGIGLVPRLTTEAVKKAALGAGAKVVGVYSYELTRNKIKQIELTRPDIVLLAGGTDGGNKDVILHNARMLAQSALVCPMIVAGNEVVNEEIVSILEGSGKITRVTENVMPEIGELKVEPARCAIRDMFMERIAHGKGLDRAEKFIGSILMPTPMAVLNGAKLLAQGTATEEGFGDLVVVDIGGATTDVDSVCEGKPTRPGVMQKGLPGALAERTVEGDLGIRYNAPHILQLAGKRKLLDNIKTHDNALLERIDLDAAVDYLSSHLNAIPKDEIDYLVDIGLARTAVDLAIDRHAGTIEPFYSPHGTVSIQRGKDLTEVKRVIGTGGIFVGGKEPGWILEAARYDESNAMSLRPSDPEFYVDRDYMLYAVGLLSDVAPDKAIRAMKKSLVRV